MKKLAYLVGGIALGLVIAFYAFPSGSDVDDKKEKSGKSTGGESQKKRAPGAKPSSSANDKNGRPSATPAGRPKGGTISPDGAKDEFAEMMGKVFSGEASEDEQLKFWEQARTGDNLARIITDLKAEVDGDAKNVPARMNLAQAYVTKLLGVPAGPEKGLWSAKAESLWREVIELEPDHWAARNSIATALSHYPPFLNKTGDAIREYEQLIEIQQRGDAEPHYSGTYVSLARLHQTNGNPAAALEVLNNGAEHHPDDNTISERITTLRSSFRFEDEQPPQLQPEESNP